MVRFLAQLERGSLSMAKRDSLSMAKLLIGATGKSSWAGPPGRLTQVTRLGSELPEN